MIHTLRLVFHKFHPTVLIVLWSLALVTLILLSLLYVLRCLFYFNMVESRILHHVWVNYLLAPFISWLLLLQSAPFVAPKTVPYLVIWWVFASPVVALDVKIYGQWFTKGKKVLSTVANPTSKLSVIGDLVGAQAAANMGWKEGAWRCMLVFTRDGALFSSFCDPLSAFIRRQSAFGYAKASLAWESIAGAFDTTSNMLFFL